MSRRAKDLEVSLVLVEPPRAVVDPPVYRFPEPFHVGLLVGSGWASALATPPERELRIGLIRTTGQKIGDLVIAYLHAHTRVRDNFGDPVGGPGLPVTYLGDQGTMFAFPPQNWTELLDSGEILNGRVAMYAKRMEQADFDENRNSFRYDVTLPTEHQRRAMHTYHDDLGEVTGFGTPVTVSDTSGATQGQIVVPPASVLVAVQWHEAKTDQVPAFSGSVDDVYDGQGGLGGEDFHLLMGAYSGSGGTVTVEFAPNTTAWVIGAVPLLTGGA